MKKLTLLAFGVATMFCSNLTKAQSHLKIGIGDASVAETALHIEDAMLDIFNIFSNVKSHDTKVKVPQLFVDYRVPISKSVNVGGQVNYLSLESTTDYKNGDHRSAKFNVFSIMPGVDVRYFQKGNFKMYGNANLGIAFVNSKSESTGVSSDKDNYTSFIYQINPIGLSYGGNTAAFLEVGFGGLSIFNLGVKFSL